MKKLFSAPMTKVPAASRITVRSSMISLASVSVMREKSSGITISSPTFKRIRNPARMNDPISGRT